MSLNGHKVAKTIFALYLSTEKGWLDINHELEMGTNWSEGQSAHPGEMSAEEWLSY